MKKKLPLLIVLILPLWLSQYYSLKIFWGQAQKSIESVLTQATKGHRKTDKIALLSPSGGDARSNLYQTYAADLAGGSIGQSPDFPVDDPFDNVFHLNLHSKPANNDRVFLQYELNGVQDHTAVSRSINDAQSVGGYIVRESKTWLQQKEEISPLNLHTGDNVVRFSVPDSTQYRYSVRNLKLIVLKGNTTESTKRRIVVNRASSQYYTDQAFVKGFILGTGQETARLYINNELVPHYQGEYEYLLCKPVDSTLQWTIQLKVVFSDGETLLRNLSFSEQASAKWVHPLQYKGVRKVARFKTHSDQSLEFFGLKLNVPTNALSKEQYISVTALRDLDLPALGADLVNVTKNHPGFRLLPDGTRFGVPVALSIPYDTTRIPAGYTAADIRTFYFDEVDRHWKALRKDTLYKDQTLLVSNTTHFTDYINGIIKVPESPQTQGYKPTEIKDLKAADPSNGITMIAPPTHNNMGTANIQFPIKLPTGRQGMQPQLAIQYNSEGGNGWLGLGWDLSIPSINIDTRWGVPQYDPRLETETYLMGGQMLTPVAHRDVPGPRSNGSKRFYPRIEGGFQKIIRHGNSPQNYWWEVVSTDGTKNFYGGLANGGLDNNAVLKDDAGNITQWCLSETRDLNGNFVRYNYVTVRHAGLRSGTQLGRQIYINQITYSGHGNEAGKYSVQFVRDRQINDPERIDAQINGRLGFKQVTADLLREIKINYAGRLVRAYELIYETGPFNKTLLNLIIEQDANKAEFYRYELGYWDEVRDKEKNYQPYLQEQEWEVPNDGIDGGLTIRNANFADDISALGGSVSANYGVSGAFSVGIGFTQDRNLTVGGHYSYAKVKNDGKIALIDINGDGLPDKVFCKKNGLFYERNLSAEKKKFDVVKPIPSFDQFSHSETSTHSFGIDATYYGHVGEDNSKSKTVTSVYFGDFNGDRLIDIVKNNDVWFNHLDEDGDPVFTLNSSDTPNKIIAGAPLNNYVLAFDPSEQAALIEENPLHDVVRIWKPPFNGIVTINSSIQLIVNESEDAILYHQRDGVRVSIEHNSKGQTDSLWSQVIKKNDSTIYKPNRKGLNGNTIVVDTSDHIYFRVHSTFDGAYDQVFWDPEIVYLSIEAPVVEGEKDPQNRQFHRYRASEDFVLGIGQNISSQYSGRIQVNGKVNKKITSDSITVQIIKLDENNKNSLVLFEEKMSWSEERQLIIDETFSINAREQLAFLVTSATNIDWSSLSTEFKLHYIEAINAEQQQVVENSKPLIEFSPAVQYSMYNHVLKKGNVFQSSIGGKFSVRPVFRVPLTVRNKWDIFQMGYELTLSIKSINKLLSKKTFQVFGDYIDPTINTEVSAFVSPNEPIWVEYHLQSRQYAELIAKDWLTIDANFESKGIYIGASVFTTLVENEFIFGAMHRGWGQFAYNANDEKGRQLIDRKLLRINDALKNAPDREAIKNMKDADSIPESYQAHKDPFIIMVPDAKNNRWLGYDELTWINANTISSSRMGDDDVNLSSISPQGSGQLQSPHLISVSSLFSFSGGASVGVPGYNAGASGSISRSTATTKVSVMDISGDGYPDIIGPDYIQLTNALGGRNTDILEHGFGNHESKSESKGLAASGGFAQSSGKNSSTEGKGSPRFSIGGNTIGRVQNNNAQSVAQTASISVGLSGNLSDGSDYTSHSWLDINGDGLADKLYRDGQVRLNLGYRFSDFENWGFQEIRSGSSKDIAAGASIGGGVDGGYNLFSFSFSGGLSANRSDSNTEKALQDINGDGLIDILEIGDPMQVRLNTGNAFSIPIAWQGSTDFDKNKSVGEGGNFSFTACIPIFIPFAPPIKICFTPGGSFGKGASMTELQLSDIDGDGYPDVLRSSKDGELQVHSSSIRRTNLLKTVSNPLGGSFTLDYNITPNTYNMPSSKWVLASVETNDGLSGDGADHSKISFQYSGGMYNRRERDFYGFSKVVAEELDTEKSNEVYRIRTYTYHNNNYYNKGLLQTETLSGAEGKKYTETVNTYELIPKSAFGNPDTEEVGIAFPALTKTENRFYEGQSTPGLTNVTSFEYDEYGNVVLFKDSGDNSTDNDILIASIKYHNEMNGNYLHAIPQSIEVKNANQTLLRKRESKINQQGDVLEISQLIQGSSKAVYQMTYDDYGNLTRLTCPKNYKNQELFYDYTYDTDVHSYVVSVTDAYGYTSSSTYDYAFGQLTESRDLNGQIISYVLDAKGRISTITSPYERSKKNPYTIKFEYHPEAKVPYATTLHYDQDNPSSPGIATYTFMDGLQRPVQVQKTGSLFTGEDQDDQKILIVSGKNYYDAFGRVKETRYPTIVAPVNGQYSSIANPTPTRKTYDVLDRELSISLPDAATTELQYTISKEHDCNCFKTRVIDALGNPKEEFKDIRERTRATVDYLGQQPLITKYSYNAISDLLKIVDTKGYEIQYEYDLLGRKLSMEHPDAGKTEFQYDEVGNLLKKITPNIRATFSSAAINYTYDYERLVQIDYPQNYQNQVIYHYGAPNAPHNRAGRIWLQEDASGGHEFFYGPLGEVTKNIRTVLVNETTELNFVWEQEYDSWNRIQTMKYPDLEEVSYEYNLAGKLHHITSTKAAVPYTIVKQLGYDEFEQRVFLKYGNGTKNTYEFDDKRRRLQTLQAVDRVGTTFMHKQYQYDRVDNITQVQNLAPGNLVTLGGLTQHKYTYDQLYRLTDAQGSYRRLGKDETYSLSMEYDVQHNIESKVQTQSYNYKPQAAKSYNLDYSYNTSKPHQAVKIGTKNYSYDPNGNQTGWSIPGESKRRDAYWDEENRIGQINENGYLHLFTYDASGERVIKSEGGIQALFLDGGLTGPVAHEDNYTAYLSPYLVYKADKFTKHYYIESQRILSKIGAGDFFATRQAIGKGITAGNKDYGKRNKERQEALKNFLDKQGIAPKEPSLNKRQQELIKMGIPIPNLDPVDYTRVPRNWPQPQPRDRDIVCQPPIFVIPIDSFTNAGVTAGYGFVTVTGVQETNHFYYHPDHLGSTNFITDMGGLVRQFAEYHPFGETFVEEHTSGDTQPYLFNAKEYDDGTGLYYYGARYYDPVASIWVSVDPMMEKYPGWSPYNYTMLNPVRYIDPDGRASSESSDGFTITVRSPFVKNKENNETNDENFYTNGINTTFDEAINQASEISKVINQPVTLVYSKSYVNRDDSFLGELSSIAGDLIDALFIGNGVHKKSTSTLKSKISKALEQGKNVNLFTHSRGSGEGYNVVNSLDLEYNAVGKEKLLKQLNVTTMGGFSPYDWSPSIRSKNTLENSGDPVPWFRGSYNGGILPRIGNHSFSNYLRKL